MSVEVNVLLGSTALLRKSMLSWLKCTHIPVLTEYTENDSHCNHNSRFYTLSSSLWALEELEEFPPLTFGRSSFRQDNVCAKLSTCQQLIILNFRSSPSTVEGCAEPWVSEWPLHLWLAWATPRMCGCTVTNLISASSSTIQSQQIAWYQSLSVRWVSPPQQRLVLSPSWHLLLLWS